VIFQVTDAYQATTSAAHGTTFFSLYGTTSQWALEISTTRMLGFAAAVQFPGPVLTNAYGVVSDAIVTGTIVDPHARPVPIDADAYFAHL